MGQALRRLATVVLYVAQNPPRARHTLVKFARCLRPTSVREAVAQPPRTSETELRQRLHTNKVRGNADHVHHKREPSDVRWEKKPAIASNTSRSEEATPEEPEAITRSPRHSRRNRESTRA